MGMLRQRIGNDARSYRGQRAVVLAEREPGINEPLLHIATLL
jgi:hypothetical protein